MSTHAPLPPSSAARIVPCPGSARMEALYPQEETIDTRQGDAVHWAGASMVEGWRFIEPGEVAENGELLNVEMLDAAGGYADHIIERDKASWLIGKCDRHVEEAVVSGAIHPENYGTPDYWMFNHHDNHLFVDDLKYGHGFVSEIRNYQLINYAALIAKKIGRYNDDSLRVTMTIHQPRNYHWRGPVRSWSCTLGDLRYPILELSAAFTMAMAEDAPTIARDPEACRNCSARHACEALAMETGPGIDLAYSATPLKMSNAATAREYGRLVRAEKMIKARREGIEQAMVSTIQRGGIVPGFTIQHKKGRLAFKDDAAQNGLIEVAQAMNVKIEKLGLITPLQAIKAGLPEDIVKLYSHTPGGAAELVEDDGTAAANIFSK
jgi:hypothetical protein